MSLLFRSFCLFSFIFALNIFSGATYAEESRISRWTSVFVNPITKKESEITISVLDAQTTTPSLIEFNYLADKTNGQTFITSRNIEEFDLISGKPGYFKIRFPEKLNLATADFYYGFFKPYLPKSISFDLDPRSTHITLESFSNENGRPLVQLFRKKLESISRRDFKRVDVDGIEIVGKPSAPEHINKLEEEKHVTRWTVDIVDPDTGKKKIIFLSVFDAESANPVLIEFYYAANGRTTYYHGEEEFELVDGKPGHFRLKTINENSSYFKEAKFLNGYKDSLFSLSFGLADKNIVIETYGDQVAQTKTVMEAKQDQVLLAGFQKRANFSAYLALETHKGAGMRIYEDYFGGKGIAVPYFFGPKPAEPKTEEEKRITRWTVDTVDPSSGKKYKIFLSVFDAESANPVLIEFYYESNDGLPPYYYSKEEFELVDGKPGHFLLKIINENSSFFKQAKLIPSFKDAPFSLRFGLIDKNIVIETFSDQVAQTQSVIEAKQDQVLLADFQKRTQYYHTYLALESDKGAKKRTYKDYFGGKGIAVPHFFGPKPAEPKVEEEKRITRWTAELVNPKTGVKSKMAFSVFDAETNPVLIEAFYSGNNNYIIRDYDNIEKFELIPEQPGHFRIQFKFPELYYRRKKVNPFDLNAPFVPQSVSLSLNNNEPLLALEIISDLDSPSKNIKIPNMIKMEKFSPSNFKRLTNDNSYKVLEPSTIHALPYDQYFSAKGIYFPHITSSNGSSSYGPSPLYSYKSISSAKDLELGDLLKGKEKEVWQLLQSKDKPTITEFLKAIGIKPKKEDKNPFKEYLRNKNLKFELEHHLPEVIAQFEKAFPGAVWYGLGRDIYLFADAMDAYYLSTGQTDRVKRLHASQPSFDENNPEVVIDFLKSNGFDFSGIDKDSTPRIIFDVTSYSKNKAGDRKQNRFSQSAQLMKAAYLEWQRLGRKPHDLLSKVNFVSVSDGPSNFLIEPGTNVEEFFSKMDFDPPAPQRILRVWGPHSLQYATSWHSIYERFQRTKDNKVIAPFGNSASNGDKLAMLAEFWDVAAIVMNDDFMKATDEQIKKYKETPAVVVTQPVQRRPKAITVRHVRHQFREKVEPQSCDDVLRLLGFMKKRPPRL